MKVTALNPLVLVSCGVLALPGVSRAQANASWNPIYPTPGYDTYQWTMTVEQLPIVQSVYYYWALQNGFVGGNAFYMGIQPYGGCGITNAGFCKVALFSFFGNGASSASSTCATGADGGPGESCRIPYDWVVGHQYKLTAALTSNDGTNETWTGTIADVTAGGAATAIGSWSIPSSNGLIGAQGISFTEYYDHTIACSAQPYAEVLWDPPTGFNGGQAFPGTLWYTSTVTMPSLCPQNVGFTIDGNSVYVQTGGFIGPFVAAVQDAESGRASVVPGEWAAIYGKNLSNSTRTWNSSDFPAGNGLPTSLDGVSVSFKGIPAAVYYISPGQLDVQVPGGLSGNVPVTVSVAGAQSPAFTASVVQAAPSLFVYTAGPTIYAAAQHSDGSLVGDAQATPGSSPAVPGEVLVLYANGVQPSPSGTIISTVTPVTNPVTVSIGGMDSLSAFTGLVEAGVFQINVAVPSALDAGPYSVFSDLTYAGQTPNNTGAGECITGASTTNCGPMTNRWVAAPFTPGGAVMLSQIDLALGWLSGTNGAVINLVNDNNGVPGTSLLETWTVTNLQYTGPADLVSVSSTSTVPLQRGTQYWIVVEGMAPDTLIGWNGSNSGQSGGAESEDGGVTWTTTSQLLRAFDVLGTPAPGIPSALAIGLTTGEVGGPASVVLPVLIK